MFKNWETTLFGIFGEIFVAGPEILLLFDNDPITNPNWNLVLGSFSLMIGLIRARDANKTSEQSIGVQKTQMIQRQMYHEEGADITG